MTQMLSDQQAYVVVFTGDLPAMCVYFLKCGGRGGQEEVKSSEGTKTFPLWPLNSDFRVVKWQRRCAHRSQMRYFSSFAPMKLHSRSKQMYTISTLLLNGWVICHVAPFIWTSCETQAAGWEGFFFSFFFLQTEAALLTVNHGGEVGNGGGGGGRLLFL